MTGRGIAAHAFPTSQDDDGIVQEASQGNWSSHRSIAEVN
jgi:hypothetical protein